MPDDARKSAGPRRSPAAIDLASVTDAYDRYARVYDRLFGWVLQHGRRALARALAATPGRRIVEIGVGSGLMLPLYPAEAEVTGVDVSPGMLREAQARVDRLGLSRVSLHRGDGEHTGLPAHAFDHVVLPYVYSVTPDPAALIEEAFRLGRRDGSVWVLNHFSGIVGWGPFERLLKPFARRVGFRSDFSYAEHVESRGWDIVSQERVNLFGLSLLIRVRPPSAARSAARGSGAREPAPATTKARRPGRGVRRRPR